jgi:hypothetical protein
MSELNKEQQAFLTEFNWHNYAEGIDAVDQKNLQEFEDLVSKNLTVSFYDIVTNLSKNGS